MKFGYVRVSTKDQNPDRQVFKMCEIGIAEKNICVEKESGLHVIRQGYSKLRDKLREGDVLYLDSLDRLGRNYEELQKEWKYLTREICVDVVALDFDGVFDSRKFKAMGDVGRFVEDMILTTLSWVAEQERTKIRTRQAEGIKIAKKTGLYKGRTPIAIDTAQFKQEYNLWKTEQITATVAMRHLGLKPNTFYRRVAEYEKSKKNN